MFKRVTLVWRRADLTRQMFADHWLGEHAQLARCLPGLREYVVDIVDDPGPGEPDGIAALRFDSRHACEAAFSTPGLGEDLRRTRDDFAASVQVLYVDEHVVHRERQRR